MTEVYLLYSRLFYFYKMKLVVCALIIHEGLLLITQHGHDSGHPLMWEFPGGKIKPGEPAEVALVREIFEELDIEVAVDQSLKVVDYHYPGKNIRLMPFLCRWISGDITLNVHLDCKWIEPQQLFEENMLPADFAMLNAGNNFRDLLHYAGKQTEESRENNAPSGNRPQHV